MLPAMSSSGSTYKTIEDWFNTTQSGGRISGFTVTAHSPANGTVDVSSGTCIIKKTNAVNAQTIFYDFAGGNIALTDLSLNYIYLDYNSGTPQLASTTDRTTIHEYDQFIIGRAFRSGNDSSDCYTTGDSIYNFSRREFDRLVIKYGFSWASGSTLSEVGVRKLAVTSGIWYIGTTEIPTAEHDSNTGGYTFSTYYYNGAAWVKVTGVSQLGNLEYNDVTSGLVLLGSNKYANYWVYQCVQGDLYVLYGQSQYNTLANAQATQSPASVPVYISSNTKLIARISFQQGATNFSAVGNALVSAIQTGSVANHNDLAGLQGGTTGQYYHLTSSQGGVSGLTADRITLGASATTLKDNSNLTYDGTNVSVAGGVKVGTGILDSNGNEIMKVVATASAVNEITVTNAATGGNPTITATGGDTNISIGISGKGTGSFLPTQRYKARMTLSANTSFTSGDKLVPLDTAPYDTNSDCDTTNHWYTVPVTGYYLITFCCYIGADTSFQEGRAYIADNGSSIIAGSGLVFNSLYQSFHSSGSGIVALTAGHHITLRHYSTASGTWNVYNSSGAETFAIILLSV